MSGTTSPMKSVQRAFDVMDVLWKLGEAGPTRVANEMDIPRSTAHVYLQTLQSTEYVVSTNGRYKLSHAFLSMGSKLKYRSQLHRASQSALRELADETGEVVTLVIEEAGESVILHKESGDDAIQLGLYAGLTVPLYSHAAGKVILSRLEPSRIDELLGGDRLEPVTSETITDREQLLEELEEIREKGYAVDWDQQIDGMGTVGTPVLVEDQLKGSIGVACPTERIKNESYQTELVTKMREATERITIKYRYGT